MEIEFSVKIKDYTAIVFEGFFRSAISKDYAHIFSTEEEHFIAFKLPLDKAINLAQQLLNFFHPDSEAYKEFESLLYGSEDMDKLLSTKVFQDEIRNLLKLIIANILEQLPPQVIS